MKRETTYVIGHKNPDTDSICSAIGLAELKRAQGMKTAVPARAGDLNPQTAFILDHFNIPSPVRLTNVFPKARDIMMTSIISVKEETPILNVMETMRKSRIRFVPVLDNRKVFKGALTLMDLAKMYMEKIEAGRESITTTFKNISKVLGVKPILDFMDSEPRKLFVYIGAMAKESFISTIKKAGPTGCAVIVGDRREIQMKAIELGTPLLIISGGFKVDKAVKAAAKKARTSLAVSPYDSATTALFVRLSTPASLVCLTEFQKAAPDELASDLKFKIKGGNGLVVLDDSGRLEGIITKTNLLSPSGTSLILVDHNELSQAVDGADKVPILQVVDHHRIGNFTSTHAIPFICEPLGATSSIVAELYKASGKTIKKKTASLLLSGIVSDTVILKSPTTTERDKKIVKWLETKSGLKHKTLGKLIFGATSSIKKRGAKAVIEGDHKTFEVKGKSFGIGQVETIGFTEFYEEKTKLIKELQKVAKNRALSLSTILITDIVLGTSLLLAVGEKKVLYSLGYTKISDGLYELKDVISRKKQVVPHILSVFNEIY